MQRQKVEGDDFELTFDNWQSVASQLGKQQRSDVRSLCRSTSLRAADDAAQWDAQNSVGAKTRGPLAGASPPPPLPRS